jgi:translation initiation factor IF-1
MVKNTSGGSKTKNQARKHVTKPPTAYLRVSEDESEVYAQAVKILGGSICSVIDINGKPMSCHIRGKFRGRGKRDNFISPGTWLLVGVWDWENRDKETNSKGKLLNCDLLEVYNDTDKAKLKNSITNVNWTLFINNDLKTIAMTNKDDADDGLVFSDERTQEYEDLISAQIARGKKSTIIEETECDEINVDDI